MSKQFWSINVRYSETCVERAFMGATDLKVEEGLAPLTTAGFLTFNTGEWSPTVTRIPLSEVETLLIRREP